MGSRVVSSLTVLMASIVICLGGVCSPYVSSAERRDDSNSQEYTTLSSSTSDVRKRLPCVSINTAARVPDPRAGRGNDGGQSTVLQTPPGTESESSPGV